MRRRRMQKRKSKKVFRNGVRRVNRKNGWTGYNMRGGVRF